MAEYDGNIANTFIPPKLNPKAGTALLKTKEKWQISNGYYKSVFNLHEDIRNFEEEIIYFQNTIYDYFKVQYGIIKNFDSIILNIRRSTVIFQIVNSKKF